MPQGGALPPPRGLPLSRAHPRRHDRARPAQPGHVRAWPPGRRSRGPGHPLRQDSAQPPGRGARSHAGPAGALRRCRAGVLGAAFQVSGVQGGRCAGLVPAVRARMRSAEFPASQHKAARPAAPPRPRPPGRRRQHPAHHPARRPLRTMCAGGALGSGPRRAGNHHRAVAGAGDHRGQGEEPGDGRGAGRSSVVALDHGPHLVEQRGAVLRHGRPAAARPDVLELFVGQGEHHPA